MSTIVRVSVEKRKSDETAEHAEEYKMTRRIVRNGLILVAFGLCIFIWQICEATLWFLSPSFPNENGKGFAQDLLVEFGGEEAVTVSQIAHRWRPALPDENGQMNLLSHFLTTDDKVIYALTTFRVETPGIAVWRFGSDDGIKVWVNGEPVYSLAAQRGARKDSDECLSRVAAGENAVLLKIYNGVGDWGFFFRLAEVFPQGVGRRACVASVSFPPYLLYGSKYPIEQWAAVRILNSGTELLDDVVLQLETDGAVIGKTAIAELPPVAWVSCRVRLNAELSQPRESVIGKAVVLVGNNEVGPGRSFTFEVKEVHPLLTGRVRDEDGVLRFVHATDTHVIADDTVLSNVKTGDNLKAAIRAVNGINPPPDFVMVTGDLTLDSAPGLNYFEELVKSLRVPWLAIPGNHDKPGGEFVTVPLFGRHGLPLYYSFDYGEYHLVALDGQPPSGSPVAGGIVPEEIGWFKRDLDLAGNRETLVFVHQHPLITRIGKRDDLVDWPELVKVLEEFSQVKWVFCGHAHADYFTQHNSIRYVMTTATAYQFSPKEVPYFANEAGVRLMEYKDGKMASRFLRIDGTWRDDPSVMECPVFVPPPVKE